MSASVAQRSLLYKGERIGISIIENKLKEILRPGTNASGDVGNLLLTRWMLSLCWQFRRLFALAAILQVALTLFAVFGLNVVGLGIDYLAFVSGMREAGPAWPLGWQPPAGWTPMEVILLLSSVALLSAVAHGLLFYGAAASTAKLVHGKLAPQLQRQVFGKLQEGCMRFYSKQPSGAMINRATGDIQAVRSFVDLALMEAITLIITVSIYVVFMYKIHSLLALACMIFVPLMALRSLAFSQTTRPLFLSYREAFDRMILYLSEAIRGAEVIRGFSVEDQAIERMRNMNKDIWECQSRIFRSISLFGPSINLLSHASLFALIIYGGHLVISGQLALGAGFVVFAGLLQQFANRIANVAQIANATQESLTGARRLHDILNTKPSVQQPDNPLTPQPFTGRVRFDRVTVSYNETRNALSEVDFEVEPGEIVALAGETAAGKSSLLNLIPRLYDPDRGIVSVSGVDARRLDLQCLRRNVGVVFQDAFIFSQSIAENIRFGNAEAPMELVVKAAKIACANEFIVDLENGYDTIIGEMGVDLSGGQRQRLSIARALLPDPKILLLDDPTSAIDPRTEKRIFDGLKNEMSEKTTFIVAHRVSTLARADRIIVMKEGRIVQIGAHDELMGQSGAYSEMVATQFGSLLDREVTV